MEIQVRSVITKDLTAILKLNEQAMPHVNRVDMKTLQWFTRTTPCFRVAEIDGNIAGFLIALTPEVDYDSQYFRWFRQRYSQFVYIDRVVVAEWARRRGVGFALFEDLETYALGLSFTLASEVYSHPPNEASLKFHTEFGFKQIGSQVVEDGTKVVAKFMKQPAARSPRKQK